MIDLTAGAARTTVLVDAYDVLGPIGTTHPAYRAGLRGDSSDAAVDILASELLDADDARYDATTLLPALLTWRSDLAVLAEELSH